MNDDIWDDPELKAFFERADRELAPKVAASNVTVSLYSGKIDPKFAMELGYMILLDKPIVVVNTADKPVPPKLLAVAAEVITADIHDPDLHKKIAAAVMRHADEEGATSG